MITLNGKKMALVMTEKAKPTLQEKIAIENGEVKPDYGYDGLSKVTVNVPNTAPPSLKDKTITKNGTYNAESEGYYGYGTVTVDVDGTKDPVLQPKTVTKNGVYSADSDGVDGYSSVTVNVPEPSGTKEIIANGTYDVKDKASVNVKVPSTGAPTLQEKTVTKNGVVTPDTDEGYNGLSKVIVEVPSPDLSRSTITAEGALKGLAFYDATGSLCTGTIETYTGEFEEVT